MNKMHPIIALRKLPPLEKKIVNSLIPSKTGMSQADLIKRIDQPPSQATVSRAVRGLITAGILKSSGNTKGSRVHLSEAARHFATPPSARPQNHFDPFRIAAYEPNVTKWLNTDARERMVEVSKDSKGQLDASTYSRQIAERFLIDLSWASSHLEGNTYNLLDTELLIKYGQEADGHDREEALMLMNHKRSIGRMLEGVGNGLPDELEVQRLHALMMNGLMDPSEVGAIRRSGVGIRQSSYKPSNDPLELLQNQGLVMFRAQEIEDPFEASFFTLAATSYLQAFGDGNKRMGRLLSSAPLLEAGLPPISFVDIDMDGYILGLIAFYEMADTQLLSSAIADNYAMTAPHYQAALTSHRVPSRIEVKEGQRIAKCIRDIVVDDASKEDAQSRVDDLFEDLDDEDKDKLTKIIRERLSGLNPIQAIIYGLDDQQVSDWLESYRNEHS